MSKAYISFYKIRKHNTLNCDLIAFVCNPKSVVITILLFTFACNAKSIAIEVLGFSFLFFFLLVVVSGQTGKSYLSNFHQLFLLICVTKTGSPSLDTLVNDCAQLLKFRVCEHGVSCARDNQ